MTVEVLRWPQQAARRYELQRSNVPCLLLVASDCPPPRIVNLCEDWVRLPSDACDIDARVEVLARHAHNKTTPDRRPKLDDQSVLRVGASWISLSEVEARLMSVFVERFDQVSSRTMLFDGGWPEQEPSRNLLDVHLHKLRRRIGPLGLSIRTVRKRGYVLEFV